MLVNSAVTPPTTSLRKARCIKQNLTTDSARYVSTPRMGQQHHSPGQSVVRFSGRSAALGRRGARSDCPEGAARLDSGFRSQMFGPFRANAMSGIQYPGRRCALPWAKMFKPVGLRIAIAHCACHIRIPLAPSTRSQLALLKVSRQGNRVCKSPARSSLALVFHRLNF